MENVSLEKILPDVSDLNDKIEELVTKIFALGGENEEEQDNLSCEMDNVKWKIWERYQKAKVPYERCNHPDVLRDYEPFTGNTECRYCSIIIKTAD